MSKMTICLWFDDQAEEAAKYYVSVFKDSKLGRIVRYPEAAVEVSGKPAGSVMTAEFELNDMSFMGLNGGKVPGFELSGATSFIINCDTQDEIDHYWEKLSAVPEAEQCGWCTDKFGVTWQVVPRKLDDMMSDSDPIKVERVTSCFMKMKKMDIAELEKAFKG